MPYRNTLESENAKLRAEVQALKEQLEQHEITLELRRKSQENLELERELERIEAVEYREKKRLESSRAPLPGPKKGGGSFLDWFR